MRVNTIGLAVAACAISMGAASAQAAPTMYGAHLPITADDIVQLKQMAAPEDGEKLAVVIERLQLYEDHENPKEVAKRNDKSVAKVFYGAPFLTPSKSRSVVGAQEFAKYALDILDALDTLVLSFNFDLRKLERLSLARNGKAALLTSIEFNLASPNVPEATRTSLTNQRAGLQRDVDQLDKEIETIRSNGKNGAQALNPELRKQLVNEVIYQMSRLGLSPTEEEKALMTGTDSTQMTEGIARIRKRASNGQLGLRQVVMESGLDEEQAHALSLYRRIRPDVQIKSLNVKALLARPSAQTYVTLQNQREEMLVPMMLRAINGEDGSCGALRSCNVVIEYTSIGARSASVATTGAVLVPVRFVAKVEVAVPDFAGRVKCDMKQGWSAQGRADVRDGAIIYDGDVTDKIKFNSTDESGCHVSVERGSLSGGEYEALKRIHDELIKVQSERRQRSKADKDAYERYVRDELDRHARESQSNRRGWFGDVVGIFAGGFPGVAVWLVGQAREFYWHTRIEDTASYDEIHVDERIDISNAVRDEVRPFDGFPLVCFKKATGSIETVMAACPDALIEKRTTEAEAGDRNCGPNQSLSICRQLIENTPPNPQGFLESAF